MNEIGPIDVQEIKLLKASFARELAAGATIQSATWSCEVASGVDADAAARLVGAPINEGSMSQHLWAAFLPAVTYSIRCRIVDSAGLVHVAATLLTVQRFTA